MFAVSASSWRRPGAARNDLADHGVLPARPGARYRASRAAGYRRGCRHPCILLLMQTERRRHLKDRLAAREALQQAHDRLELKVAERTADLSAANQRLQAEVAERTGPSARCARRRMSWCRPASWPSSASCDRHRARAESAAGRAAHAVG